MREEYTRSIEPSRALAAENLKLERTLSDLVNQATGLTPAEIELMWQTAPPRRPIPPPATARHRDPAVGEHRERLGKIRLLTPPPRSSRMGPQ